MSKVGFWLKGSTGKLAGTTLYKGANGETIQREVVSPSNPKTQAQNIQRIVMSTVGAAYSVMKAICDHSFEGVKKGQETMSLFMSENIQKSRAAIEEMQSQGVAFLNMYSFVPVGMKHAFAPNQYLSVSLKDIVYYFKRFLPLFPSNTCICWIAIWLSFTKRSPWGIPSLIRTALIFSMFERQMSSLIVA